MPTTSEVLVLTLLLSALAAVVVAYRMVGKATDRLLEAMQTHQHVEDSLDRMAQSVHSLMVAPKALPRIEARPCTEEGFEGYVELDIGNHSDAVRVVIRTNEGDPTDYGLQVLRVLLDNSDPGRAK